MNKILFALGWTISFAALAAIGRAADPAPTQPVSSQTTPPAQQPAAQKPVDDPVVKLRNDLKDKKADNVSYWFEYDYAQANNASQSERDKDAQQVLQRYQAIDSYLGDPKDSGFADKLKTVNGGREFASRPGQDVDRNQSQDVARANFLTAYEQSTAKNQLMTISVDPNTGGLVFEKSPVGSDSTSVALRGVTNKKTKNDKLDHPPANQPPVNHPTTSAPPAAPPMQAGTGAQDDDPAGVNHFKIGDNAKEAVKAGALGAVIGGILMGPVGFLFIGALFAGAGYAMQASQADDPKKEDPKPVTYQASASGSDSSSKTS